MRAHPWLAGDTVPASLSATRADATSPRNVKSVYTRSTAEPRWSALLPQAGALRGAGTESGQKLLDVSSVRDHHLRHAAVLRGAVTAHVWPPVSSAAALVARLPLQQAKSCGTLSSDVPSSTAQASLATATRASSDPQEAPGSGKAAEGPELAGEEERYGGFVEAVLRDGECLFRKGEEVEHAFFIVRGTVELMCLGRTSQPSINRRGETAEIDEGSSGAESTCPFGRGGLMETALEEDLFQEDDGGRPYAASHCSWPVGGAAGAWSGVLSGIHANPQVCFLFNPTPFFIDAVLFVK